MDGFDSGKSSTNSVSRQCSKLFAVTMNSDAITGISQSFRWKTEKVPREIVKSRASHVLPWTCIDRNSTGIFTNLLCRNHPGTFNFVGTSLVSRFAINIVQP